MQTVSSSETTSEAGKSSSHGCFQKSRAKSASSRKRKYYSVNCRKVRTAAEGEELYSDGATGSRKQTSSEYRYTHYHVCTTHFQMYRQSIATHKPSKVTSMYNHSNLSIQEAIPASPPPRNAKASRPCSLSTPRSATGLYYTRECIHPSILSSSCQANGLVVGQPLFVPSDESRSRTLARSRRRRRQCHRSRRSS